MNFIEFIKSRVLLLSPYTQVEGEESYKEIKEKVLENNRLKLYIETVFFIASPLVKYFLGFNTRIWPAQIILGIMIAGIILVYPLLKNNFFKTCKSLSNFYLIYLIIDVFCFTLILPFWGFAAFLYVFPTYWIFFGALIFPTYWQSMSMLLGTYFSVVFVHLVVYFGWIEVLPIIPGYSTAYLRDGHYVVGILIALLLAYYFANVWFACFWRILESKKEKIKEVKNELQIEKNSLDKKVKSRTEELNMERTVLEKKVAERTEELNKRANELEKMAVENSKKIEELESFKRLTVARELRMIELKNEIERLKK